MKEAPFRKYERETGRKGIVGTMATESKQRRDGWLKTGCNAFDANVPLSKPMSFWTEQDVLRYLKQFNIPYADAYGDIVEENGKLKTTGLDRTGCMFCMFGAHLEKEPNRFQQMKENYPKQYDFCIRPIEENGLGLGKVMDYIGVKYE
jgi:3'-phosphoadenosine 5'-phosphosulfate sulfotransferase (PAPS reductase)/FAD synthetase